MIKRAKGKAIKTYNIHSMNIKKDRERKKEILI
jgi:hypothetical protein